jgi:hypothetical protein
MRSLGMMAACIAVLMLIMAPAHAQREGGNYMGPDLTGPLALPVTLPPSLIPSMQRAFASAALGG